jgi:UDP-N-acetylmuramyl tripeptide synthase
MTSDNPRGEDPEKILDDIEAGIRAGGQPVSFDRIPDRRAAIARALELAHRGDIVVIAGKGHETYQILKDKTIHFDDREVVRELLSGRG